MKILKRSILTLGLLGLLTTSTYAENQKHLIFLEGDAWTKTENLNVDVLENLPFSGFGIVGNTFTLKVMNPNYSVKLSDVKTELSAINEDNREFTKRSESFLKIGLDFPGEFWTGEGKQHWASTITKFRNVAQAAYELGFKGIILDDEVYSMKVKAGEQEPRYQKYASFLSNFKFPRGSDIKSQDWEIEEAKVNRGDWIDYNCYYLGLKVENNDNCSYRSSDKNYTFQDHMNEATNFFERIMLAMEDVYPNISVIVLHGPSTAHYYTNHKGRMIKPNAIYESNEFKGAIFLGLKKGLNDTASLHDMGEFYQYTTKKDFSDAYQWRKYDIAKAEYNENNADNHFNLLYRWAIPEEERDNWSEDVTVGFMVTNYGRHRENRGTYNTVGACNPEKVEGRLDNALEATDKYVIFYNKHFAFDGVEINCRGDGGIEPNQYWTDADNPVSDAWMKMVGDVVKKYQSSLQVSSISAQNISSNTAKIVWDISDYATGQVEYGKTADYGQFSKKETSFTYNHHEQLLRNLEPNTSYHYRVISIDEEGNEAISDDYTFKTQVADDNSVVTLISKESVSASVAHTASKYYKIHAKAGQKVTALMDNLSADADLYMKIGSKADFNSFDCNSTHSGTAADGCFVNLTHDADVYITVYGYKAANYTLMAKIENLDHVRVLKSQEVVKSHVAEGAVKHYKIRVKAGRKLKVSLKKLSANADLRLQIGSKATANSFVCESTKSRKKKERCSIRVKHTADVYIAVFGKQAAKYRLKAKIKK